MTLKQACPPEYQRAQCAFKNSMIHENLQFTLTIIPMLYPQHDGVSQDYPDLSAKANTRWLRQWHHRPVIASNFLRLDTDGPSKKWILQLKSLAPLFSRLRSRSLSQLSRQITPPTKNGHAPPPTKSRKSSQSPEGKARAVTQYSPNGGPAPQAQRSTTSFLTATTLIYAIGAGITAAAGTRLALQLFLVVSEKNSYPPHSPPRRRLQQGNHGSFLPATAPCVPPIKNPNAGCSDFAQLSAALVHSSWRGVRLATPAPPPRLIHLALHRLSPEGSRLMSLLFRAASSVLSHGGPS
ncbi:hypothetical protein BRETT_001556 [Brettanomyces bruxellensis]|uniref:Uncharacterized protein n=1 Tax=Dekkera bruxellensis TaxID=5007 RepID=A0A871R653_DEKBR|nr:hypothetical protein BRETT_001556 [Brettanomyces bruxellensis]